MKRKVYVAGPMTGYEHYNVAAFERAAALAQACGWEAVTPFECNSVVWRHHYGRDFDPRTDKCDYGDPILPEMLAEDLRTLISADDVAFLPGWEKSRGATLEYAVASALLKPIYCAFSMLPLESAK